MSDSLRFSDLEVDSSRLIQFLVELDLLPLILKRYIERKSSASFKPSQSDQISFQQSFLLRENISTPQELENWLSSNDLSEPLLSKQLYHSLQLKLLKESMFSSRVESTYLDNKSQLDLVMFSIIRSREPAKVNEIYLRLNEEESTFADLATHYSEGNENQFNGLVGPVEFGRINPNLSERLRISKPGQLWPPFELDGWWVLLRLEKLIPSKFDQAMKDRIITDLYSSWIKNQVNIELAHVTEHNDNIKQLVTPLVVESSNSFAQSMSNDNEVSPSFFKKAWNTFIRSEESES